MLPYALRIERPSDILRLERDIRRMLRCDSHSCAFMQSAEYALFKIDARHALRLDPREAAPLARGATPLQLARMMPRILPLPGGALFMHVSADCRDVAVRERTAPLMTAVMVDGPKKKTNDDDDDDSSSSSSDDDPTATIGRRGRPSNASRAFGFESFERQLIAKTTPKKRRRRARQSTRR